MREIHKVTNNCIDDKVAHHDIHEHYEKITLRLSVLVLNTLKNIIISNKAGGNYQYVNISDIVRNALEAYKNGMQLTTQRNSGLYKETSCRIPKELKDFYISLPNNVKTEIIDRSITTYINNYIK
jgi:hypothetical protein